MIRSAILAGLRVLLVEDEMMVSLLLEDLLVHQRCIIVGPFGRMNGALDAARNESIDLAVLDVNIDGVKVYPVAEILAERRIPFLFVSGYGDSAIPENRPKWRVCSKPFRSTELIGMLAEQFQRR